MAEAESGHHSKQCFVISPIGSPGTPTRLRADKVYRHIIVPAVEACGYEPDRADRIDTPGLITNQIIQKMLDADLVVADLTELNANVMYELGIRHAARKPTIHIMEKVTLPFDISHHRAISFDHTDLDSAHDCKEAIRRQILAIEADPGAYDNPVTVTFDLKKLHESDRPEVRAIAELTEAVQDIRSQLDQSERIPLTVSSAWSSGGETITSPSRTQRALTNVLYGRQRPPDSSQRWIVVDCAVTIPQELRPAGGKTIRTTIRLAVQPRGAGIYSKDEHYIRSLHNEPFPISDTPMLVQIKGSAVPLRFYVVTEPDDERWQLMLFDEA